MIWIDHGRVIDSLTRNRHHRSGSEAGFFLIFAGTFSGHAKPLRAFK